MNSPQSWCVDRGVHLCVLYTVNACTNKMRARVSIYLYTSTKVYTFMPTLSAQHYIRYKNVGTQELFFCCCCCCKCWVMYNTLIQTYTSYKKTAIVSHTQYSIFVFFFFSVILHFNLTFKYKHIFQTIIFDLLNGCKMLFLLLLLLLSLFLCNLMKKKYL